MRLYKSLDEYTSGDSWVLHPEIPIHYFWGVACDSAFLTNSPGDSVLVVQGPHVEKGGCVTSWDCNRAQLCLRSSARTAVAKYPSTKIFREMTFIQWYLKIHLEWSSVMTVKHLWLIHYTLTEISEYTRVYLGSVYNHTTYLARTLWLNRGGAAYSPRFKIQMKY